MRDKIDKKNYKHYLSQLTKNKIKLSDEFKKLPEETQINTLLNILNGIKELNNREDNEYGSSEN